MSWMKAATKAKEPYLEPIQEALVSLADKDDELCSAVEAWALAEALLWEEDSAFLYSSLGARNLLVRDWSLRFRGRPTGAVRAISKEIREAAPEHKQTIIRKFTKDYPYKERKSA